VRVIQDGVENCFGLLWKTVLSDIFFLFQTDSCMLLPLRSLISHQHQVSLTLKDDISLCCYCSDLSGEPDSEGRYQIMLVLLRSTRWARFWRTVIHQVSREPDFEGRYQFMLLLLRSIRWARFWRTVIYQVSQILKDGDLSGEPDSEWRWSIRWARFRRTVSVYAAAVEIY
jgi:hypothetical protein